MSFAALYQSYRGTSPAATTSWTSTVYTIQRDRPDRRVPAPVPTGDHQPPRFPLPEEKESPQASFNRTRYKPSSRALRPLMMMISIPILASGQPNKWGENNPPPAGDRATADHGAHGPCTHARRRGLLPSGTHDRWLAWNVGMAAAIGGRSQRTHTRRTGLRLPDEREYCCLRRRFGRPAAKHRRSDCAIGIS